MHVTIRILEFRIPPAYYVLERIIFQDQEVFQNLEILDTY
jgi:hypothetical protein